MDRTYVAKSEVSLRKPYIPQFTHAGTYNQTTTNPPQIVLTWTTDHHWQPLCASHKQRSAPKTLSPCCALPVIATVSKDDSWCIHMVCGITCFTLHCKSLAVAGACHDSCMNTLAVSSAVVATIPAVIMATECATDSQEWISHDQRQKLIILAPGTTPKPISLSSWTIMLNPIS